MYWKKILSALLVAAVLVPAMFISAVRVSAENTDYEYTQKFDNPIVSVTAVNNGQTIPLQREFTQQGQVIYITAGTTLYFDKIADSSLWKYTYFYKDPEVQDIFIPQSPNDKFVFKAVKQGNFFIKVSQYNGNIQNDETFAIVVTDGAVSYSDNALNISDTITLNAGTTKTVALSGDNFGFIGTANPDILEIAKVSNNVVCLHTKQTGIASICLFGQDGTPRIVTVNISDCIKRTPSNDIVKLNSSAFTSKIIPDGTTLNRQFSVNTGKQIIFSKVENTAYTYQYFYRDTYGQDICIRPESPNDIFKFTPLEPRQYIISVIVRDKQKGLYKKEIFTINAKGNTIAPVQHIDTIPQNQSKTITFSDNVTTVWRNNTNTSYSVSRKNVIFKGISQGETELIVITDNGHIYENYIKVAPRHSEPFVLTKNTVSLDVKNTYRITFSQKGDDTNFTYKSVNPSVAAVSKDGVITAVKAGTTEIIVSNTINVQKIKVTVNTTSVKLNYTSLELFAKEKITLKVTLDTGSNTSVQFSSSNPTVASVSSNGTVTALKGGTAIITARTANNKTASCKITVIEIPSSVTLNFAAVCPTVHIGNTVTLDIQVSDKKYNKYVSVSVSDNTKAAVSYKDGRCTIKGLKNGKVYLTASLPNGRKITTFFYSVGNYEQFRTNYAVEKGIDLSCFNETVNYQKLKEEGYTFVILRAGFGDSISQKDTMFEKHIQGAKKAGLGIGIYYFSYAVNTAEAKKEAQVCNQIIAKYRSDIQYGVFYDYEDDSVRYATQKGYPVNKKVVSDIIVTFCEEIERYGYIAGVYSNTAYGYQYLDMNRMKKYMFWYAAPGATTFAFDFDIWQYSFWLTSPAFRGEVDGDKIYSTVFRQFK